MTRINSDLSAESINDSHVLHRLWCRLLGVYLLYYVIQTWPYRIELYGDLGVFKDHTLFPWLSYFPVWLLTFDQSSTLSLLFSAAAMSSSLLVARVAVRFQAFLLWAISCWLFNRNPFSDSPEYGFINWLLIGLMIVPHVGSRIDRCRRLRSIQIAGWVTLSLSYFYAAITKLTLGDSSWLNGDAVYLILTQDNSRRLWFGSFFESIPKLIFSPITFLILSLQLLGPILIGFRSTRLIWWISMTTMHIGALAVSNLNQLSLGMLLFHLFLFEERWLQKIRVSPLFNLVSKLLQVSKSSFENRFDIIPRAPKNFDHHFGPFRK